MDPLSALREFTMRNELDRITRVNGEFHFGDEYTFPCSIQTSFRSKQGNLYSLETLIHFIQHENVKHTDYLQSSRSLGIPSVTYVDRKPIIDYLTGKLASSDNIVFPLPQHQQNPNHEYRPDDPSFLPESTVVNSSNNRDGSNYLGADSAGVVQDDGGNANDDGTDERVGDVSLILSVERPLKDRETLLECKNRDFYSVLVAATRREEERQRIESQSRKDGLVAKTRLMDGGDDVMGGGGGYDPMMPKPKMHLKGGKIGEGVPIILVPSAFQTLITIYNVKEFLEDGVFIPTDVKAKQMNGPKPECVTVQKKFSTDRNRVMTAYEVRDKPSALKVDDWDRVVAVFVLGKEWQFKDWPFKDHVEIFNRIIGFYMRFEDDSVESAKIVKQWNVKIISISKNKRHQDRAAALEVWDRLEEFVRSRSHS